MVNNTYYIYHIAGVKIACLKGRQNQSKGYTFEYAKN